MELYQLQSKKKKKPRKRVGRGGKRGTFSGRGVKGQKAHSGKMPRAGFAGGDTTFAKRFPKQRGAVGGVKIKRGSKFARLRKKVAILNLQDLKGKFKAGEAVTPVTLRKKGLLGKAKGKFNVKILGLGESGGKFTFKGVHFSKAAAKKLGIKEKKKKHMANKSKKAVMSKKEKTKKKTKAKKQRS